MFLKKKKHLFKPYIRLLNKKQKNNLLMDFYVKSICFFFKKACFFNFNDFRTYFISFNKKKEVKIDRIAEFYKSYNKAFKNYL